MEGGLQPSRPLQTWLTSKFAKSPIICLPRPGSGRFLNQLGEKVWTPGLTVCRPGLPLRC